MLLDAMPDQKANSLSSFLSSYIALIKANSRLEWVIAEISEIADRNNGHIYLDLIEQDADGQIVAKCKAAIWKGLRAKVLDTFAQGTGGGRLAKGMKVMVLARAGMHV